MLALIVLTLINYIKTPIKDPRYLFALLLPATYFSTIAIEKIKRKKIIAIVLISLILISFSVVSFTHIKATRDPYTQKINYLNAINETREHIEGCGLCSNAYLHLNYLGIPCEKAPNKKMLSYKLDEGYKILLFRYITEPWYVTNKTFLNNFPILIQDKNYVLLGTNQCAPIKKADSTYLESINEFYRVVYNESFSITFYELFFTNKSA